MLLVFALAVPATMLAQGSKDEQQIRAISGELVTAFLRGGTDAATVLDKYYADEYTGVRGDGTVLTKAQEIEAYKSGSFKYQANEVKDLKISVYGKSAISTSLSFSDNVRNGKRFSGNTRNVRYWVKQQGSWKCVYYQTTRVLEPASAQMPQNAPPSYVADPAVYKLVGENDQFRIIMSTKAVGQRDAWHSHFANTVYAMTDCHLRTYTPDGQSRESNRSAGSAYLQPAIPSHSAENIGTAECRQLIVERK